MLGEISAFCSSLVIACSAVISRSLAVFITARPLQTMRAWFGAIFLLIVLSAIGKMDQLAEIPLLLMGFMFGSAFVGIVVGDTIYIRTLRMVEVSRSFPLVRGTQIISSMIVASIIFDEAVTWVTAVGVILIMSGVYLAVFAKPEEKSDTVIQTAPIGKWLPLAIIVGLCWTTSFSFMKAVLLEVDPVVAQTFKLPIAALMLTLMTLQARQGKGLRIADYRRKTMILIIIGGIFSYGTGALLELYAISFAGLAKAAILTSWTPLFVLLLSTIFIKERLTPRLILGTILCSGGTAILVIV